jgi:hypothetical protein
LGIPARDAYLSIGERILKTIKCANMVRMGMSQDDGGDGFPQGNGCFQNTFETEWHPSINQGKALFFFNQIDIYREEAGKKCDLVDIEFTDNTHRKTSIKLMMLVI